MTAQQDEGKREATKTDIKRQEQAVLVHRWCLECLSCVLACAWYLFITRGFAGVGAEV